MSEQECAELPGLRHCGAASSTDVAGLVEVLRQMTPARAGAMVAAMGLRTQRACTPGEKLEARRDSEAVESLANALPAIRAALERLTSQPSPPPTGSEREKVIEECAKVADDWAAVADAAFLAWAERARNNMDGMDVAGGCAIGMAHQARRIAEAIRARASAIEAAQAGETRSGSTEGESATAEGRDAQSPLPTDEPASPEAGRAS